MIYIIDYLTFSCKEMNLSDVYKFLDIESIVKDIQLVSGFWGYEHATSYNGIFVLYGSRESITVNMSGTGCRAFESVSSIKWEILFKTLVNDDRFNVTRLDLACDDKEGILPLKRLKKISDEFVDGIKDNVATKFEWCDVHHTTAGLSMYYGSPKSDIRIRIYDKAAERGFTDFSWSRCEIQLRDKSAVNAIKAYLNNENMGKTYTGILKNYLNFVKNETGDIHNKSRNKLIPFWKNYLQKAEKIKVYEHVGMDYNLPNLERYLKNQISNSLHTYVKCIGDKQIAIDTILDTPKQLNKKQKDLIAKFDLLRDKEKERKERLGII